MTSEVKKELYKKLKTMPAEELWKYRKAAKTTNMFLNITGVTLLFCMIVFDGFVLLAVGSILVYIAAQLSSGVGETLSVIDDLILENEDD